MIELSLICEICWVVAYWLSLFIGGFLLGVRSWNRDLYILELVTLVIGGCFTAILLTQHSLIGACTSATIYEWGFVGLIVAVYAASSLGSGYLCGRAHHCRANSKGSEK